MIKLYSGIYQAKRADWYQTFIDRNDNNGIVIFDPKRSLEIVGHSPDGFAWGYRGSGPAQLSLAILLEDTDDEDLAKNLYMDFMSQVISQLPNRDGDKWVLDSDGIQIWIKNHA